MKKRTAVKIVSLAACAVVVFTAALIIQYRRAVKAEGQLETAALRNRLLLSEAVDEIEKNCMAAAVLNDSQVRNKYCCRAYSACKTAENCLSNTAAGESVYLLLDIIKEECLAFGAVGSYSNEIASFKVQLKNCGENYEKIVIDTVSPAQASLTDAAGATVSEEEARQAAARFMGVEAKKLVARRQTQGAVPCYCFIYQDASVYVSRRGGKVRLYVCDTLHAETLLSAQTVYARAQSFLEHCGCEKTVLVSRETSGGLSTFVFACVHSGIPCLNETVKITVSAQTGKVVFYDSTAMLINCRTRTVPENTITPEQAANALSGSAQVLSSRLVFINDAEKKEKLCLELTVLCQSEQSLVYVDAVSGETVEKGESY